MDGRRDMVRRRWGFLRAAAGAALLALTAFAAAGCVNVEATPEGDEACDCVGGTCPATDGGGDGGAVACPGDAPLNANQAGLCEGSRRACVGGAWRDDYRAVAGWEAAERACDGLDNDCDGDTDEELGERACGAGACAHKVPACAEGAPGVCDPFEGAAPEACNEVDDDCDGLTDTDDGDLVAPAADRQGGVCAGARQVCAGEDWAEPAYDGIEGFVADEGATECDGRDNDCDGETDEGCACPTGAEQPCGSDEGDCEQGTQACVDGAWSADCVDEVPPADGEACDDRDNDCDGETDEAGQLDPPGADQQAGVCEGATKVCESGGWVEPDYGDHAATYEAGTETLCDALDNDCDGETDEALCDDGDVCNGTETCDGEGGQCQDDTPLDCDDDDVCTTDSCDAALGCQYAPSGVAGCCESAADCDDGNPCTADTCDQAAGMCRNELRTGSCSDGDACTTGDRCDETEQACVGTPRVCDDGNACNGVESCDSATGCVAGTPPACNDDDVCNGVEDCDPELGCLGGTPLTCDDGDACDGTETCDPLLGCQDGAPPACDDGDVCDGVETCDPATGCRGGVPLSCDDGNACDGLETCDPVAGCQAGTPPACDDGDACNGTETCDPIGGCEDGTPLTCDDGDVCTGTETCNSELGCQPGTPLDCDDQNDCTLELCDAQRGCVYVPSGLGGCCEANGDCDDGSLCTLDTCDPETGVCTNAPLTGACDDGNDCTTDDQCADGACSGTPAACDDGDPCNGTETCVPGSGCQPGAPLSCDDGNPCTDDSCEAPGGCAHANNVDLCDDGDACTTDSSCVDGACHGLDPLDCDDDVDCTLDDCDPLSGCTHSPVHEECAVAYACVTAAQCVEGVGCVYQDDGECLDNDPCNGAETCDPAACLAGDPSCSPTTGCRSGTPPACGDGNPCNGVESCQTFVGCVSGSPPDCDDGNDCTNDACVTNVGCRNTYKTNGIECSTGDPCRIDEACTSGVCGGGSVDPCDDGGECTVDTCVEDVGCSHTPSDQWCRDTYSFTCLASVSCGAGGDCTFTYNGGDAEAACTNDDPCDGPEVCDPVSCVRGDPSCLHDDSGCLVSDPDDWDGEPCDDGDPCTRGDTCAGGACVGGADVCSTCTPGAVLGCNLATGATTTWAGASGASATSVLERYEGGTCNPQAAWTGSEVAYPTGSTQGGVYQAFFVPQRGADPSEKGQLFFLDPGDACRSSQCLSEAPRNPLQWVGPATELIAVWDTTEGETPGLHTAHGRCFTPGATSCAAALALDDVFQCVPSPPPGLYTDYGETCTPSIGVGALPDLIGPEKVWSITIPGDFGVSRLLIAFITDEEGHTDYYKVFLIPSTSGCGHGMLNPQNCAATSIARTEDGYATTAVAAIRAGGGSQWCVVVDSSLGIPPSKYVLSLTYRDPD